jgi:hypothetical protein
VRGPGWAVDEVPGRQTPHLALDDQRAFTPQDEKVLLACFVVVERHWLAR